MGNIRKFVANWTELADTPAAVTANQFVRGDGAGSSLVFFDLLNTANSWGAEQTFQNVRPDADDSRTLGLDNARWSDVSTRRIRAVDSSGAGTINFDQAAGTSGAMFGFARAVSASSNATLRLANTSANFRPALVAGLAYSSSTGFALVEATRGGSTAIGSAFSYGAGNAALQANGYGTFVGGYAYCTGTSGDMTVYAKNTAPGSFVWGYATGSTSATGAIGAAQSAGGFACGRAAGGAIKTITCRGDGSFAQGFVTGSGSTLTSTIRANGQGSFAQGSVNATGANSDITPNGTGSFAQGAVGNGSITTNGQGAFAQGIATNANIQADGAGSFAQGNASGTSIIASAANSVQFGPGTNALADSLQVGSAGLRLKGTAGAPAAPQNGDIWVAGGFVYIQSNGVAVQIV